MEKPDIHWPVWIIKMWSTQTMECYSAMQTKDILTHATTCVNLIQDIMLSEIHQTWKD